MNRISELRKKLGLTQTRLGEEIGVSQQTISKYENVDENISGDMLLALSKFFKVPVDYILRKDEEEQQREQDNKREIMELYRDMDQYNRDTCNGVQREHNKKLNNGLPILHKVPPKRDYGRYFCIMAEKGGTSHGGLTEKLSPFFHAKKQEVNAYGR